MNANPLIERIFEGFKIDGVKIPVSFLFYTGKADSYLTYFTLSEEPRNFHANAHHSEISNVTIDVFSKKNFKNLVEIVKQKMITDGFIWQGNSSENYESDTQYFHVPLNFQISTPINF